jgi:hypothetical protein
LPFTFRATSTVFARSGAGDSLDKGMTPLVAIAVNGDLRACDVLRQEIGHGEVD